jgi:hypothetical protein
MKYITEIFLILGFSQDESCIMSCRIVGTIRNNEYCSHSNARVIYR